MPEAPIPAPPVVDAWVGTVVPDVPPVVPAPVLPAALPPVVEVPPAVFGVVPVPMLEPPVVDTCPDAAGGVVLDPDDVEVDVEPVVVVFVLDEVDDAGADATPVVGTVNVGIAPVSTVPPPPPLPHPDSAKAVVSTPMATTTRAMWERRASMTSEL